MTTYTALNNTVWFGQQLVCRAVNDKMAVAIAEAMNEWQKQ